MGVAVWSVCGVLRAVVSAKHHVKRIGDMKKSILYKLVKDGKIVDEGNRKEMKRLAKSLPGSFVGVGSPLPSVGREWK